MSTFPCAFADGGWHEICELRSWEAALLCERLANQNFSSAVRGGKGGYGRQKNLRNKELLPLKLFAKHEGVMDRAKFRLMPDGHPIDAEISCDNSVTKLQITVAWPGWHSDKNSGYQDALQNELLDFGDVVNPTAHFHRNRDGVVICNEDAPSEEERLDACRLGLKAAIQNKKNQEGKEIILIIYARDYEMSVDDQNEFARITQSVLADFGFPSFDRVCFLTEGWFVESSPADFDPCASA